MVKDPVCGMEVDETKSEFESHYGGKSYFFCSDECLEQFEENPEHYIANAA